MKIKDNLRSHEVLPKLRVDHLTETIDLYNCDKFVDSDRNRYQICFVL